MGIRVDKEALVSQLKRQIVKIGVLLPFHKALADKLYTYYGWWNWTI